MSDLSTYYQQSYDGGLNDTASSYEIARNEASVLRNWDITYQGQLRRRPGLTLVGDSLGDTPITGLGAFIRNAGIDLLAMESTNLYFLAGSSWTKIADDFTDTAGLTFWLENIQALGKVFIGNEDNVYRTWDRAGTTLNTCLTTLTSTTPHGNLFKWFRNYALTFNNANVSGTKYPNRAYLSAFGDPTSWTTGTDYIDVPGDGRLITGVDLGDNFVFLKERSIQYLTGYGVSSWTITEATNNVAGLSERVGCVAPRGAVRVGNEVWFVDNQAQIRRIYQTDFDAMRHDVISKKIQGTLAGLNKGQLAKAAAWSSDNKVYFAFPSGASTTNDLVCVFDILASIRSGDEAWTTYTGWSPAIFADYPTSTTIDLYLGDQTTGKVYKHAGDDDDGVAIDAQWDGKDDYYDKPERWKRYKYGYIRASSGSSDASVDVYGSVDGGPFAQFESINLMAGGSRLGPTGSFLLGPTGDARLGGSTTNTQRFFFTTGGGSPRGKSVKMSLRHDTAGQTPSVNTFSTHYKLRNLR
jgi:hypothetical protein